MKAGQTFATLSESLKRVYDREFAAFATAPEQQAKRTKAAYAKPAESLPEVPYGPSRSGWVGVPDEIPPSKGD